MLYPNNIFSNSKYSYIVTVRIFISCHKGNHLSLKLIICSFFAVVTTSTPSNEAELQLYRVLQRASLLAYYDTLLEMGKT